jgi:DNA-binding transcriptional LysR family regulator
MSRNLDIALLRTFVAVADHSSMTVAGNALHLTQSAVSQQIARLEDLTGRLFIRERRTLRLSAAGERLLSRARQLIALNDEIWSSVADSAIDGKIRLGAPYDLIGAWLTPILKDYAEQNPLVEVALVCLSSPDLLTATETGHVDLALVEEPVSATGGELLSVDRLVWVGARGGSAHMKTPLPVSLVAETCAFRPAVINALLERERSWRMVFESGSIDATRATVRADLAVTAWLESTVPEDLEILHPDERLPELPCFAINLYRCGTSTTRACTELAQSIRRGVAGRVQLEP